MNPTLAQGRELAGVLTNERINFRFEVWAYRPLTEQEVHDTYWAWQLCRDRRQSMKNKTVQIMANHGMDS